MLEQTNAVGTLLERPRAVPAATVERPARRAVHLRKLPSLRERTRAGNRARYTRSAVEHFERVFRCECARPSCQLRLPLDIERHRRWPDLFIVGTAHGDGDTIVGVADHFLVVQANGLATS
jgi:hypothetical protein